ncbi:Ankyrin repeat-containing domain protein [Beauveria brongniartii RCEF 3172]|uniref:Ankyrin repeat-containing domain protein n=1 Tax=Beauveria brongniartii RCEF 3172 TaxID=1081107 RepID=A0A166WI32_9HYPO|nr:Ankyrin repeat-containing domain protein [Beauveria brongniartii RCEF 3172]
MALIDLPPELLVAIASFLGSTGCISKFARTNRRMFQVLEHYLYRYDVKTSKFSPKALRITSCFPRSRSDANSIIPKSLAAGADVNASLAIFKFDDEEIRKKYFTTAISMAALTENAALIRILLEAGAKVNSTCWIGVSVLGYAMEANNIETVHLLLAQPGIDLNYWSRQQDTALLTAVARDKLDFAEVLLPLVDPNQIGKQGITPLRLAVRKQNDSMVSLLLSDSRTNPNNMTARPSIFALACSLSSTKIVELLHDDWRTDVESSGGIEQTPARMAFVHARFSNMDFLIRSAKCKTARHNLFCLACCHGDLGLAEKVLELATHDDEQFLERWEEAAQTAGWEELATRVAKRWGASRTTRSMTCI